MNAAVSNAITNSNARVSMPKIYAYEAWASFVQFWRIPAFAVPTLLFPLVFYAMFALILPSKTGGHLPAQYLLATYGAFAVIGPALSSFGIGMAIEQELGWLKLKRISPMPIGAYFTAKILMAMVFGGIVVACLSLLAVIFGDVSISAGRWFTLWGLLILGTLPFCAMGLMIGLMTKSKSAVAIVNLIYLPMSVLSGLWFPVEAFPAVMQSFAKVLPAYHLGALALHTVDLRAANVGLSIAVLLAYSAVFVMVALWLQRRRWNP
jgi:ABC-2 type transport system permease protein